MDHVFKFALGSKVKDRFTEFNGVVISACAFFYSENTYGVQASSLHNEHPVGLFYFDERRLELIEPDEKQIGFVNDKDWNRRARAQANGAQVCRECGAPVSCPCGAGVGT